MKKIGILLFVLCLFVCAASAENWKVSLDGSGQFTSLTEAVNQAAAGDTILLGSGVYDRDTESFPIVLDQPITIVGEKDAVLDSPRFTTLIEVTSDDVHISCVTFAIRKWGIVAKQSQRLILDDCTFYLADEECRTSSTAMWMEGMENCTLRNCHFEGLGVCVAGDPLSASSDDQAKLTGLCEVGTDPAYFTTHVFDHCTVNGKPLYYFINEENVVVPEDAGGMIVAFCDGVMVENVDVSDNSMGLEIVHCNNVTLRNVLSDRCGIFGTYIAFVQDALLDNVQVHFCNHGIDTRASKNVKVVNCLAEDSDQGIFWSMCEDSQTIDCQVIRCGFGYFAAVGQNNAIEHCSMTDNADGIYLQNEEKTTIQNCHVQGSTVAGLRLLNASCTMRDTLVEHSWTGALLYGAHDTLITVCQFVSNASANLYFADTNGLTISECDITGETKVHLETERTIKDTMIQNCTFSGQKEKMLKQKGDSDIVIIGDNWIE